MKAGFKLFVIPFFTAALESSCIGVGADYSRGSCRRNNYNDAVRNASSCVNQSSSNAAYSRDFCGRSDYNDSVHNVNSCVDRSSSVDYSSGSCRRNDYNDSVRNVNSCMDWSSSADYPRGSCKRNDYNNVVYNVDSCVDQSIGTDYSRNFCDKNSYVKVATYPDLVDALEKGKKDEQGLINVRLVDDICVTNDLILPDGANLDLNGHTLSIFPDASIIVGRKDKRFREKTVHHKPRFERRSESIYTDSGKSTEICGDSNERSSQTRYYDVLVPAYEEKVQEAYYEYDDTVKVKIFSNGRDIRGKIVGLTPSKASFIDSSSGPVFSRKGYAGISSKPLFKVLSGSLTLENLVAKASDGGEGGEIAYAPIGFLLWGGSGGDGGKGGNGADVFFVEPDHGKVLNKGNCTFVPGEGGRGGRGTKHNPNYWFFQGSDGVGGCPGCSGRVINYSPGLIS